MDRTALGSVILRAFLLLSVNAWAQDQLVHGLWVWKTPALLADPHGADTLREFCRIELINEVYFSFSRVSKDPQLASLVHALHKSSIHVEALLSSNDADEPGPHREKLLNELRDVIEFNRSHTRDHFDGIHLDIEPQQRPENKGPGNLNFLPGLVDTYRSARYLAESAHLTINADIQIKLLKGDLVQRRSLLSSLPRLTLMLYELSSPSDGQSPEQKEGKLRRESEKFMGIAYQGLADPKLAKMAIGLRTPDYDQLMATMLKTVDDTLRSNPHYLGWGWHSYNN
jgi:hypothetical protein